MSHPTEVTNAPIPSRHEAMLLHLLSCLTHEPLDHGRAGPKTIGAIREGWKLFTEDERDQAALSFCLRRIPGTGMLEVVDGHPDLGATPIA